jgi:hypothetical protein
VGTAAAPLLLVLAARAGMRRHCVVPCGGVKRLARATTRELRVKRGCIMLLYSVWSCNPVACAAPCGLQGVELQVACGTWF